MDDAHMTPQFNLSDQGKSVFAPALFAHRFVIYGRWASPS